MHRTISTLYFIIASTTAGVAHAQDLELATHGGAVAQAGDGGLETPGIVLGVAPLFRLTESVAAGPLIEYSRVIWPETRLSGGYDNHVHTLLLAGALRWYFLGEGALRPHVQAALGYGFHSRMPDYEGCSSDPGVRIQLSGGPDVSLTDWARVGASLAASGSFYVHSCLELGTDGRSREDLSAPGIDLSGQATFTAFIGS